MEKSEVMNWSEDNEEKENDSSLSPSKFGLRNAVKMKLDKLGKLYAGEEVSSPIHRSFEGNTVSPSSDGVPAGKLSKARSARLAALANTINNWEDDLSHSKRPSPTKPQENPKILALRTMNSKKSSPSVKVTQNPVVKETKKIIIEDSVARTLEAQGFQRCESKQHLVYDYSSPTKSPGKCLNKTGDLSPVKIQNKNVSKVVENFPKEKPKIENTPSRIITSASKPQSCEVLKMAAKYEESSSPKKTVVKDPTELSIADRKALFERGDGTAILPKAPFAMAVPSKLLRSDENKINTPLAKTPNRITANIRTPHQVSTPVRAKTEAIERPACGDNVTREILERRREIEDLRNRWERKRLDLVDKLPKTGTSSEEVVAKSPVKTSSVPPPPPPMPTSSPFQENSLFSPSSQKNNSRKEDVTSPQSSPKKERKSSVSPSVKMALEGVKPIRVVSPPKGLYPSVADIETDTDVMEDDGEESELETINESAEEERISDNSESMNNSHESSMESESSAMSFGKRIVASSRENSRTNLKRPAILHVIPKVPSNVSVTNYSTYSNSSESPEVSTSAGSHQNITADESRVLHEIDDFLDEALGEPTPPKKLKESVENVSPTKQQFRSPPQKYDGHHTPVSSGGPSTVNKDKEAPTTPLVYTVSLYRKQQTSLIKTPIKREVHKDLTELLVADPEEEEQSVDEQELVEKKMEELKIEVKKQLTIISQASQALNLCMSSIEFSGSTEELEAEKLLLLATSRRIAATHELERLTVERKLSYVDKSCEDGTLKIESLAVKAKRIPSALEETIHLLCLVKSGCTVQATEILPLTRQALTDNNRLMFKKPIQIEHAQHNMQITVEVYSLTNKGFMALHNARGENKEKLKLTPKKSSKKENKRHFAVIESPAGPNAVRSPSFQMTGYMVFTLKDIGRNHFTLNKVPGNAPIDGFLEMKVKGQVNLDNLRHEGFLTLFQEIGGFGAWKRAWSILRGQHLSFCSYPDPERALASCFETIDLSECINREVGLAPKDVCVRSDTIMIECKRFATDTQIIRYLLSADSIQERLQWCHHINKVLNLLRIWNPVKNV
ncbi:hypothetical protein O3M35_010177 [Rhynocoris fuscipes]|uniref:PH domain-containing protein n=1 Tax=Rhynocoris fuscipes TaxID=488301 RepID=A0AAW1D0T0_9HEMI